MKSFQKFLLNGEESARRYFEHYPFLQAFFAGIGVIIFWRGIWEWLDNNHISPILSIIIGILILFFVGVFVQTFIGNTIIIKNVEQEEKKEKHAIKKMAGDVDTEEVTLASISAKIDQLTQKIESNAK